MIMMKAVLLLAAVTLLHCLPPAYGEDICCSGNCVATWKKCAGSGIPTQRPCCSDKDQCVFKSNNYSQCRPKSKKVPPPGWPAASKVIECKEIQTDAPEDACYCDGDNIIFTYETAEFLSHDKVLSSYNFMTDVGCYNACQDDDRCVAYEYGGATNTDHTGCWLFDDSIIADSTEARPNTFSRIVGFKCFFPDPICDPATRDVRQVNPFAKPYFMAKRETFRSTKIRQGVSEGRDDIVTECANLCAMGLQQLEGGDAGFCMGFALDGDVCTLLYPDDGGFETIPYNPLSQSKVYSIEKC